VENPGVRITHDSSPFTIVNRRSPVKNAEQNRKEQLREARVAQQKARLAEDAAEQGTALEITRGSKRRNFEAQKAPIERNLLKTVDYIPVAPTPRLSISRLGSTARTAPAAATEDVQAASAVVEDDEPEDDGQGEEDDEQGEEDDEPDEPDEVFDDSKTMWYHGPLPKKSAEKLVTPEGSFLVRDAKTKGEFVLTVEYKGKPTHHAVKPEGDVLAINGKASECKTLKELVTHLAKKRKALKWPIPLVAANGISSKDMEKKKKAFNKDQAQKKKAKEDKKAKKAKEKAKQAKKAKKGPKAKVAAPKEPAAEPADAADVVVPDAGKKEAIAAALQEAVERGNEALAAAGNKTWLNENPQAPIETSNELVASFDANAVDFVRSRDMRDQMWKSRQQFSNVTAGAAPSKVSLDSEILQRETGAQSVAADILRHHQHTGQVAREGADVSFFDKSASVTDVLDPFNSERISNTRDSFFTQAKQGAHALSTVKVVVPTPGVGVDGRLTSLEKPKQIPRHVNDDILADMQANNKVEVTLQPPVPRQARFQSVKRVVPDAPEPDEVAFVAPPDMTETETPPAPSEVDAAADTAEPPLNDTAEPQPDGDAADGAAEDAADGAADGATDGAAEDAAEDAAESAPSAKKGSTKKEKKDKKGSAKKGSAKKGSGNKDSAKKDGGSTKKKKPKWLHGKTKKSDAEELVGTEPDGRFLVRDDGKGGWVITVAYKGKCTHHAIKIGDDGNLALNGTATEYAPDDLADLIEHLAKKRKALKWPVPLVVPVSKRDSKAA